MLIATILNQIDGIQYPEFIEKMLYYISGFIVAKMMINCQFCKQCLLGTPTEIDKITSTVLDMMK